jgi:hypothetical protein
MRDYRFGGEADVILANAKAAILTWPQVKRRGVWRDQIKGVCGV